MIGQSNNKRIIESIKNNFPKFSIIVGQKGSGKKEMCKYIAKELGISITTCDIKADEVREVIKIASGSYEKILYVFPDADNMSLAAKNALLKITEEPPEDAYFIMTVRSEASVLDTLKSRANVMKMDLYTNSELKSSGCENEMLLDIADNFYEIEILKENGQDLVNFATTVLEVLPENRFANCFKIRESLNIRKDEGYDFELFLKVIRKLATNEFFVSEDLYEFSYLCKIIRESSDAIAKLQRVGANVQMVFDMWIMGVRV